MLQCPVCENPLDQDFGMVTCSNCQAVLMVDYSGQVQVGGEVNDVEEPAVDSVEEISVLSEDIVDEHNLLSEPLVEENHFVEDSVVSDSVADEDFAAAMQSDFIDDESVAGEAEEEQESDDIVVQGAFESSEEDEFVYDLSAEADEEPLDDSVESEVFSEESNLEPEVLSVDSEPVDITAYANSEESNLDQGELSYDIHIRGLDSKELKEALKYVLLDEKLKLNHNEHLQNIHQGSVSIPALNPIKAKRIVEQLQYYDLDVRWVQKRVIMEAYDEADIEGDDYEEVIDDVNV